MYVYRRRMKVFYLEKSKVLSVNCAFLTTLKGWFWGESFEYIILSF